MTHWLIIVLIRGYIKHIQSQKLAERIKPGIQDAAHAFAGLFRTCGTVRGQDKYTGNKNNLPLHRDVIMICVIIED